MPHRYRIGEANNTRMRSITDSQTGVEFDPYTLKMMRNITWSDNLDKPAPPITYESGSAHPQWDKESGAIHVHEPYGSAMAETSSPPLSISRILSRFLLICL